MAPALPFKKRISEIAAEAFLHQVGDGDCDTNQNVLPKLDNSRGRKEVPTHPGAQEGSASKKVSSREDEKLRRVTYRVRPLGNGQLLHDNDQGTLLITYFESSSSTDTASSSGQDDGDQPLDLSLPKPSIPLVSSPTASLPPSFATSHVPTPPSQGPTTPSQAPTTPSHVPTTPSQAPTTPSQAPTTPSHVPTTPSHAPTTPSPPSSPSEHQQAANSPCFKYSYEPQNDNWMMDTDEVEQGNFNKVEGKEKLEGQAAEEDEDQEVKPKGQSHDEEGGVRRVQPGRERKGLNPSLLEDWSHMVEQEQRKKKGRKEQEEGAEGSRKGKEQEVGAGGGKKRVISEEEKARKRAAVVNRKRDSRGKWLEEEVAGPDDKKVKVEVKDSSKDIKKVKIEVKDSNKDIKKVKIEVKTPNKDVKEDNFKRCEHVDCVVCVLVKKSDRDLDGQPQYERRCTDCGKQYPTHGHVRKHTQNMHNGEPLPCTVEGCELTFQSKSSRDRHSRNEALHRRILEDPVNMEGGQGEIVVPKEEAKEGENRVKKASPKLKSWVTIADEEDVDQEVEEVDCQDDDPDYAPGLQMKKAKFPGVKCTSTPIKKKVQMNHSKVIVSSKPEAEVEEHTEETKVKKNLKDVPKNKKSAPVATVPKMTAVLKQGKRNPQQDVPNTTKSARKAQSAQSKNSIKELDSRCRLPLGPSHRVLWNLLLSLLRSCEASHTRIVRWTVFPSLQFEISQPEELTRLWALARENPDLGWKDAKQTLATYQENNLVKRTGGQGDHYQFTRMPTALRKILVSEVKKRKLENVTE